MMNTKKLSIPSIIAIIVVLVLACIAPFVVSPYFRSLLFEMAVFAALGSAWNIIGGFARQTSWASGSFFSVGAYAAMILFIQLQISPWIGMIVGVIVSIILALIIGLPTLRLRGVYFAIATIACEGTVTQIWKNLDIAGRNNGITLPNLVGINDPGNMVFTSDIPFYFMALIWLLIVVGICIWINRSKLGYYLKTIRDDEDAAIAMGLRTQRIKLIALVISSAMMAVTGAFFAFKYKTVNPSLVSTHDVSVKIAICAIIGGMGTIVGPIIGGVAVVGLFQLANSYLGTLGGGGAGYLVYGLLMMLVVIFRPQGLISLWKPFKEKVASLFKKKKEVDNL